MIIVGRRNAENDRDLPFDSTDLHHWIVNALPEAKLRRGQHALWERVRFSLSFKIHKIFRNMQQKCGP